MSISYDEAKKFLEGFIKRMEDKEYFPVHLEDTGGETFWEADEAGTEELIETLLEVDTTYLIFKKMTTNDPAVALIVLDVSYPEEIVADWTHKKGGEDPIGEVMREFYKEN